MRRLLAVALILVLFTPRCMPKPVYAYSGTIGIWAQRNNDFTAKNFAGTVAGLRAAIAYVDSAGQIQLGPGTLAFTTDTLLIPKRDIKISGAGQRATILTYTGSGRFITLGVNDNSHSGSTEPYNGTASHTQLIGMKLVGTGMAGNGITDWDSGSSIYEDLEIQGFSNGYYGIGADGSKFYHCYIHANGTGAFLGSNCQQNRFIACTFSEDSVGINAQHAPGGIASGCDFVFNTVSDFVTDETGTPLFGGNTSDSDGWTLVGNWYESAAGVATPRHIWHGRNGNSSRLAHGLLVSGGIWEASNTTNFMEIDAGTGVSIRDLRHLGNAATMVKNNAVASVFPSVIVDDDAAIIPSTVTMFSGQNLTMWTERGRESARTAAFATPYTPVGSSQEIVELGALTNNLTINAPSPAIRGFTLTIRLIQDGTGGRTVTWNTVFKNAWSDANNTAGKRSVITHYFDGTNWIQTSYSPWY